MNRHKNFILSPITNILQEVATANVGIGDGIETYPLSEYVLQSVFLKMTGFQEQKMKWICWELATNDYEYRYKRYTKNPLEECSTYEEKKTVYKDLIDLIKKHKPNFDISQEIDKRTIRRATIFELKSVFIKSNLSTWSQSDFNYFINNHPNLIKNNHFATTDNLFENVLQDRYILLYNHRNRCAHNTLSYQENLPTLKELFNKGYIHENYPMRFSLLILIDKIFIELYGIYLRTIEEH